MSASTLIPFFEVIGQMCGATPRGRFIRNCAMRAVISGRIEGLSFDDCLQHGINTARAMPEVLRHHRKAVALAKRIVASVGGRP